MREGFSPSWPRMAAMRKSRRTAGVGAAASSTELRGIPAVFNTASRSAAREKGRSASHRKRTWRPGLSPSSRPTSVCRRSSSMGIPAIAAVPSRSTSTTSGRERFGFARARNKIVHARRGAGVSRSSDDSDAMQHDQGGFALRAGRQLLGAIDAEANLQAVAGKVVSFPAGPFQTTKPGRWISGWWPD